MMIVITTLRETKGKRAASDSHSDKIMDNDDNMDFDDSPRRTILDCYQPKMYREKKQDFQKSWLVKHRWLGYNQQLATGYCYSCQKYTKSPFRFSDLKHSEYFNQRLATDNHITAMASPMMKWNGLLTHSLWFVSTDGRLAYCLKKTYT